MKTDVATQPIRVLLVEDDEDDFLVTRDALRSIGPKRMLLEWVDNCEQALAELATGRHDVGLLDYRLGAMTGLELLQAARQRGWRGPAILLTGMGDDEVDHLALEAGAADFLVKSQLTPTLLERSIRYALQHARTLETLRRSQESFHTLIEKLPEGICVMQEGRIVYVNPMLVSLTGCSSADELLGRSSAELVPLLHPDDLAALPRELHEAMKEGRAVTPWEVRLLRKTGGTVPVEISQVPGMFEGRPCAVRSVRDLTERKQLEGRLLRADRMASLGTLAAGIAHEINNPLAFTIANLQLLEAEVLPGLGLSTSQYEDVHKLVGDARLGAGRVRDIVRQLKMFSRAEEDARPEPVDVHRVLETAISMASNEIRHRARLVRDYTEPTPWVLANEGRLGQVFINLLVNAAHAIPEGGVERNEIRLVTRSHSEGVAVEVHDTGSGIPAENLERLFEPFFTTKPVGVGTGLGLSICQDIVTGFGGRMEVKSELGRGSTFRVILRIAAPSERPVEQAVAPVSVGTVRRSRILVVDDEPMICQAIRRTLHREHEVVTLTSAREAQVRLTQGERFDLILCDVMMPEMSGMDLHQELSRDLPELAERLVFLSGGAFTASASAFLNRGDIRRLDKPFTSHELRELVRTVLSS
ncbi:response regulator [Archangium sp.]|uniref:hybrid sensor histidine kinase/response regulator n=1 Tax=Archangium sp. TaxID=1872627 RepID=UPI00286B88B6|nr:response regulator [Archangium sp.]